MEGGRGRKAYAVHLPYVIPAPAGQPMAEPVGRPALVAPVGDGPADEVMCDVLSPAEFGREMTELLLEGIPELTGRQILQLRLSLLEMAQKRGWADT